MEKVESIFSAKYFPVGLLRGLKSFPGSVGKWGGRERVVIHSQRKGQYGEIVRNEGVGLRGDFNRGDGVDGIIFESVFFVFRIPQKFFPHLSGNKRNFIDTAKRLKTFLFSMVQVGCSDSSWLNIGSCGGVCFRLLEGVPHFSRFCLGVE